MLVAGQFCAAILYRTKRAQAPSELLHYSSIKYMYYIFPCALCKHTLAMYVYIFIYRSKSRMLLLYVALLFLYMNIIYGLGRKHNDFSWVSSGDFS